MEARRRRVEADIAGDALLPEEAVQPRFVRHLMDEAARLQLVQEVRFQTGHGCAGRAKEALLSQSLLSQARP